MALEASLSALAVTSSMAARVSSCAFLFGQECLFCRWIREPAGQWMMALEANSSALHAFLAPHGWGPERPYCRGCGPDAPTNPLAASVARLLAGLRTLAGSYAWATGILHSAFWTNAAILAAAAAAYWTAGRAQAWLAAAVAGLRRRGRVKVD